MHKYLTLTCEQWSVPCEYFGENDGILKKEVLI